MKKEFTDEKLSLYTLLLCLTMFLFVILGRYSFTASIVNFVDHNILTKTQCGFISSMFMAVYAVGTIVFGFLGDKISPFKLVFYGVLGTAAVNLAVFFTEDYILLVILWTFNGIVQSTIFSPLIGILSSRLNKKHGKRGLNLVSMAYPIGLMTANLLVVCATALGSYKYIFLFTAAAISLICFFWVKIGRQADKRLLRLEADIKSDVNQEKYAKISLIKLCLITGLFTIMPIVLIRGLINGGTTTWIPTMLYESYSIAPLLAQSLTIMLSLSTIIGIWINIRLFKMLKNEIAAALIFLTVMLLPLYILTYIGNVSLVISLAMLFIINICVSGNLHMLNVLVPSRYGNTGKVSLVTGIINSIASLGFIIAGYLYGYLAETKGWKIIIIIWIALSLLGILFALLSYKKWKTFIKENNDKENKKVLLNGKS